MGRTDAEDPVLQRVAHDEITRWHEAIGFDELAVYFNGPRVEGLLPFALPVAATGWRENNGEPAYVVDRPLLDGRATVQPALGFRLSRPPTGALVVGVGSRSSAGPATDRGVATVDQRVRGQVVVE